MKNILFLNHKQKQCGVYQYGYRSAMILKKSRKYNFIYCEIENETELVQSIEAHNPSAIIYNYVSATMGWLNKDILLNFKNIPHYGIYHEGNEHLNGAFDKYIIIDSTFVDSDKRYSIPRPLFEGYQTTNIIPSIPTIGSFGFGFHNKGFENLVKLVNKEFDEAIIRLHIPSAFYGDASGDIYKSIAYACQSHITKPGINLSITHDFLTDHQVLEFLSGNTVNAFLYDNMVGRGLSSVIDYALSVRRPIAITNSYMFRHISNANPSICIEKVSLHEIMNRSGEELNQYRDIYSNEKFIAKYEQIMDGA